MNNKRNERPGQLTLARAIRKSQRAVRGVDFPEELLWQKRERQRKLQPASRNQIQKSKIKHYNAENSTEVSKLALALILKTLYNTSPSIRPFVGNCPAR
jgi:hypothetical protein